MGSVICLRELTLHLPFAVKLQMAHTAACRLAEVVLVVTVQCGVRFDVLGLLEFGLFCSVWRTWIAGVWAFLFCLTCLDCWSFCSFGRGCPGGDSTVRRSVWRTWIAGVWALLFCLTYLDCWNLGSFVLFDVLGLLEFELFCAYLFSLAYSDCSLSLSLSLFFFFFFFFNLWPRNIFLLWYDIFKWQDGR